MAPKPLGKIEVVDLREQWADEARDFTPWVASDIGLELLGEEIGVELELVEQEAKVGPFSADVLARADGSEEHLVVIENQLGKTNHDHLGKIITYASGRKARIVVWIASEFTDEHRQALDWLNEASGEAASFFGLEIRLVRIGESQPAPQFRVVSSPNTWANIVRETQTSEVSTTRIEKKQFWDELKEFMAAHKTFLSLRKALPQHWFSMAIGRSGFEIDLTINTKTNRVGCELYITSPQAKLAFDQLFAMKAEIEKELNTRLDWQRLEEGKHCRIAAFRDGSIYDSGQREALKQWLWEKAEAFHRAFSPRIKDLSL